MPAVPRRARAADPKGSKSPFMTTEEVARVVKLVPQTVRRQLLNGRFPCEGVKDGNRWLVDRRDLEYAYGLDLDAQDKRRADRHPPCRRPRRIERGARMAAGSKARALQVLRRGRTALSLISWLLLMPLAAVGAIPRRGELDEGAKAGDGDLRLHSVTTLIAAAMPKEWLGRWSAREVAKAAVRTQRTWRTIADESGDDEAIDWLKKAPYRKPRGQRTAAKLGTAVHKACEHLALHGAWRPEDWADRELRPFLVQFERFLAAWKPRWVAAELTVYHPALRYAGTCDGIWDIWDPVAGRWLRLMYDIKTSVENLTTEGKLKAPYPEAAVQVCAYRFAELAAVFRARCFEKSYRRYYLLSPNERALAQPVPEVDGGVVLLLTPERFDLYPVKCDAEVFERFTYLIETARFNMEMADELVGGAMLPPGAFTPEADS